MAVIDTTPPPRIPHRWRFVTPFVVGFGFAVSLAAVFRVSIPVSDHIFIAFAFLAGLTGGLVFVTVVVAFVFLVCTEWRVWLLAKAIVFGALRRAFRPFLRWFLAMLVLVGCVTAVATRAHMSVSQRGDDERTVQQTLLVTLSELVNSAETVVVLSVGALVLSVFVILVPQPREKTSPPILQLWLDDLEVRGERFGKYENADEVISQRLFEDTEALVGVTFLGARFLPLFSRRAELLERLKSRGADIEVILYDPWNDAVMTRDAFLGYRRESGVLRPLRDCVTHVHEKFGVESVRVTFEHPLCRSVVARYTGGRKLAILQDFCYTLPGDQCPGTILDARAVAAIVSRAEERIQLLRDHSIVLNFAWIDADQNGDALWRFAEAVRLVKRRASHQDARDKIRDRYRQFLA